MYIPSGPEKAAKKITIITLSFMICWGAVLVLAQIKPFWIDEWRIIYNLKYKNPTALWGQLDLVQQFPRVYLEAIKVFCAPFDYSYFTLRFPSFLVGTLAIIFCYRLMNKIYTQQQLTRFLFVLIIISSHTFTEYFVQVKQYTMEILLSLIAIWQLISIIEIVEKDTPYDRNYILLCVSLLVAPFFSYTYPIVIAPVFCLALVMTIKLLNEEQHNKLRSLFKLWLPLILSAIGIVVFYITDASRLMKDNGMHMYWGYLMMHNGFDPALFIKSFYRLFSQVGAGLLFEIIFGIAGIAAFIFAIAKCIKTFHTNKWVAADYLTWYSVLVITIAFFLFLAGKLPIGEARLNAFTVPAIAILIISFVDNMSRKRSYIKMTAAVTIIIFTGAVGHIFTSSANQLLGAKHNKTLDIYVNTENAIILAQQKKMPIFITSAIAYPYHKMINFPFTNIAATTLFFPPGYTNAGCADLTDNTPGDWILKTFPAYKVLQNIPVYALDNLNELRECMRQLPPTVTSVLAGDGTSFHIVNR